MMQLKDFGQALAYEAFYQIIAGQQLAGGLILPRHHFLGTKFPSILTVEQAIVLASQSRSIATILPQPGPQSRPTGFGQ